MKYLHLHKLFVVIILIAYIILEMLICALYYVLYVLWNFKIPHNVWLKIHSCKSDWDEESIVDKNPIETFVRRYNLIFVEILHNY